MHIKEILPWLLFIAVLIIILFGVNATRLEQLGPLALVVDFSKDVMQGDTVALRRWIVSLGVFGPLTYFLLNIIQIVVAPIPGYPVQVLGGVLFGVVPGSICAVGGMVTGGTLAAWLGRRFGRNWLENRIGSEELTRWDEAIKLDSFWSWWGILLIPLGDFPYFLAGLSKIPLRRFALAILLSRGPFTILIVWFGDRIAVDLPITTLVWIMAALGVIVLIGFNQQERFEHWGRRYVKWTNEKNSNTK